MSVVVFFMICMGQRSLVGQVLAEGFVETVVINNLVQPTSVRFAADGRIFVAEKRGTVKVFNGLDDTSATVVADFTVQVYNYWDRGLLGLALHPDFPAQPFVYVFYTYDAPPGGTAPVWNDNCADPTGNGCVVSNRLSRFEVNAANQMVGSEQILLHGTWCQQYPSHSAGDIAFAPDGALLVSAGDGASFTFVDSGQGGNPANPCNDPAGEGGSFRAQDLLTMDDPVTFDGAVLRLNPATGAPLADNPLYGGAYAGDDAVVAYGLRNPFRMSFRPGTSELWVADVGWQFWEEFNIIVDPANSIVENFGWPCYEGYGLRTAGYQNIAFCQDMYDGTLPVTHLTEPFWAYYHGQPPNSAQCGLGGNSVSGITFYTSGNYPVEYSGAMIFADYSAKCVWAMLPDAAGMPNPNSIVTLVAFAQDPVMVEVGPQGDIFYVDHSPLTTTGTVRRIQYLGGNHPPVAVISASTESGDVPLDVNFSAELSHDPDGDSLSFAWDLNGNGHFDDSSEPAATYRYNEPGSYRVGLRVTDGEGASNTAQVLINASNTAPTAIITWPNANTTWAVGDKIHFSGVGIDQQDGYLPASNMRWTAILHHCPDDCHIHALRNFEGVATGSIDAPDHDYPSSLEISLEVTDSAGLKDVSSINLSPRTIIIDVDSDPPGVVVDLGAVSYISPLSQRVIVGSTNSVSVESPQIIDGVEHFFRRWSDGMSRNHEILAPTHDVHLALYFTPDLDDDGVDGSAECSAGHCELCSGDECLEEVLSDVSDSGCSCGAGKTQPLALLLSILWATWRARRLRGERVLRGFQQ